MATHQESTVPTFSLRQHCPTCGHYIWIKGQVGCAHPEVIDKATVLGQPKPHTCPADLAWPLCGGRLWAEREDTE